MQQDQHAEISIADFHPRQKGFAHTYTGTWKDPGTGIIAHAWLDPVERAHMPKGIYLHDAYELSSTFERLSGGPTRGTRQEERGQHVADKLRERMTTAMAAAGWQVIAKTREGKDIWQYKPIRLSPQTPATDDMAPVPTKHVLTTRTARSVRFTCEVCKTPTTQLRFPGPRPRYCSDTCKQVGEREKTRERAARLRRRRIAEQEAQG